MNLTSTEVTVFLPIIIILGLWIAFYDLKTMLITNKTVLATAGIFLVVGPFLMPLDVYMWRFIVAFGILFITFGMFSIGGFGGGDAKVFPALALYVAWGDWLDFMLVLAIAMLLAVITVAIARRTPLTRLLPGWKTWEARRVIPLGLALGATIIFYYIYSFMVI